MNETYVLLFTQGPRKGDRVSITSDSVKLGRSSGCEIEIKDLMLSRSQCCFERREDGLWIIDLASANGTIVNGDEISEKRLSPKDKILVGESELVLLPQDELDAPNGVEIDLGFNEEGKQETSVRRNALRPLLWGVCAVLILLCGVFLIFESGKNNKAVTPVRSATLSAKQMLISYERVSADTGTVFRYALNLSPAGLLSVKIDEIGAKQSAQNDRHIQKEKQLDASTVAELTQEIAGSGFFALEPSYSGFPNGPQSYESRTLTIALGKKAHTSQVLNREEPEAFRHLRERLETFSKNELGIWAIQFSTEKLTALAKESHAVALKKLAEKDVKYSNLFEALRAFQEAVFYLDTVNPKPEFYPALLEGADLAMTELENRYKEQRFRADRAINLSDWATAQRELKILCEMIPDRQDKRHREASKKLLDVEARLKKN